METIKINCPNCNHQMEYWTRNNFINCTKCKTTIPVEPCVEKVEMSNTDWHDYLYKNKIIFIDDEFDGEDTWLVYYEDEELTKKIDDIDQFIEDYKNKVEVIEVKV